MFFCARVRSLAGLMGFGIKDWSFLGIVGGFSGKHSLAAALFDGEPSIGCICFWIIFWLCSKKGREQLEDSDGYFDSKFGGIMGG